MVTPCRRWTKPLAALLFGIACNAHASGPIGYISSSSGYMLHQSGSTAVTASWQGQAPITGFSGYGAIRLGGRCLSAHGPAGQALGWESCRPGNKAQVWAMANGRLNNELGWCADVEQNRQGAGVRIVAWQCSGAINQRWKAHAMVSADAVAARLGDAGARRALVDNAARAAPGQLINTRTGQLIGVDAGTLRRSAGDVMVTAGGGQLIAAGGLN